MTRIIVGVLRGGTSNEYTLSLKTGAAMIGALPEDKYEVRDIFIDKSGVWHVRGLPVTPARSVQQVDVVLNALHGGIGEDGTVQRILDRAGVAYAGAQAMPSATSLNKILTHTVAKEAGIRMPRAVSFSIKSGLPTTDMANAVFYQFGPPYVVKPPASGASIGIQLVQTLVGLPDAIADVLDEYGSVLVEEYIRGEHVSIGVIENYRNEEYYTLPAAQVMLPDDVMMLGSDMHDNATADYRVPSRFSDEDKRALANTVRRAHQALGMRHFSRADMILTKRGPYLLEMNAVPGLYNGASFPLMLEAVGASIGDFLKHSIELARNQNVAISRTKERVN